MGRTLLALPGVLVEMDGRAEEARTHAERARTTFGVLGARLDVQETDKLIAELLAEREELAQVDQVARELVAETTTTVTITLEGDVREFTPTEQIKFILTLSRIVNVSPDVIHILGIASGSVLVTLELPEKGAQQLFSMYLAREPKLQILRIVKVELTQSDRDDLRVRLWELLVTYLNKEELKTLCFHLEEVNYDDLPGEGKKGKARELVMHLENRGRLRELVEIGKRLRPDVDWPDVS
jgi:hypothetical protein